MLITNTNALVYKPNGKKHGKSPIPAGTQVSIGATKQIPDRGDCYQLTMAGYNNAYISVKHVVQSDGAEKPTIVFGDFWRFKDDVEQDGYTRKIVNPDHPDWDEMPDDEVVTLRGAPAVFVLHESPVLLTKAWQEYLVTINPGMERRHVAALLGYRKAFSNGKQNGFNDEVPHANYILGQDLSASSLPRFDKCRTCARAVFKGAVDGNFLVPEMMDGNKAPPAGVTPKTHPHLFFTANNINAGGDVYPFPNGALYNWTPDLHKPYVFMPHVVKFINGASPVRIPLKNLVRVDRWTSPYIER